MFGLSVNQKNAIIRCVDALAELAGAGLGDAEEAIFDLHDAFGGDGLLEYEDWIRKVLT